MRNALAIAKKELSIYFTTPWAYAVFTAMVGITAFFFMGSLGFFRQINDMARAIKNEIVVDEVNVADGEGSIHGTEAQRAGTGRVRSPGEPPPTLPPGPRRAPPGVSRGRDRVVPAS